MEIICKAKKIAHIKVNPSPKLMDRLPSKLNIPIPIKHNMAAIIS